MVESEMVLSVSLFNST